MKTYQQMVSLFERANELLISQDQVLFLTEVNELTLCGALMLHLRDLIREDSS